MKKHIAMIALLLLIAPLGLLWSSGQGDAKAAAAAPTRIVYWWNEGGNRQLDTLCKAQIADFETRNPGVKVDLVQIGWDAFRTKLRLAVDGGTGPDMAEVGYDTPVVYVGLGKLFAVDGYFARTGWKWTDFLGQLVDSVSIQGMHWGLPWRGDTRVMWVRTDLVEQAGLSMPNDETWTWDDFKAFAKKLTSPDKGIYGYAFPVGLNDQDTFCWFQPTLKAYGGDFYDAELTRSLLNNAGAVQAFAYHASFVKEGIAPKDVVNWGRTDMENMFYAGRIAIIQDNLSAGTQMRVSNPALSDKITAIKMPKGPVRKSVFGAGVIHVGFDKGKAQNDLTWKFMQYMDSFEIQKQYYNMKDDNGLITVHKPPAFIKAAVKEGDWPYPSDDVWQQKVFTPEGVFGEAPPKIVPSEGFGVNEPIAMALQKMLLEDWDAKKAADFAAAGYDKQLATALWYPGKK